jgi:hypothetical protein
VSKHLHVIIRIIPENIGFVVFYTFESNAVHCYNYRTHSVFQLHRNVSSKCLLINNSVKSHRIIRARVRKFPSDSSYYTNVGAMNVSAATLGCHNSQFFTVHFKEANVYCTVRNKSLSIAAFQLHRLVSALWMKKIIPKPRITYQLHSLWGHYCISCEMTSEMCLFFRVNCSCFLSKPCTSSERGNDFLQKNACLVWAHLFSSSQLRIRNADCVKGLPSSEVDMVVFQTSGVARSLVLRGKQSQRPSLTQIMNIRMSHLSNLH